MEKIIVLGIGNRLMRDDGVGVYLTEELANRNDKPNIEHLIGEADIDYCLDRLVEATFVIIIDAVISGNKPGQLTVYPLAELHEFPTLQISQHNLHLFQMFYYQKETIKGFLIAVEPWEIGFHQGLSDILLEKWSVIIEDATKIINELSQMNGTNDSSERAK